MSTPQATRGQHGGTLVRGGRGISSQANRARGNTRGTTNSPGQGRGASTVGAKSNARAGSPNAEGLLRQLREGTTKRGTNSRTNTGRGRGSENSTPFDPNQRGRGRGRGRGGDGFANNSQTFNTTKPQKSTSAFRAASPAPAPDRDFMNSKYNEFQKLQQSREEERAKAIRDGFLADPDKKTTLDKAITPVGTCTDMCPRFERVERIVQNAVDRAERELDEDTGKYFPVDGRMVKRFRRSAAGYDEQLPSDIRTPATLKKTLDYLLDTIIDGADRLAPVQKFVWDRTRGIRNDFSIQQVTKMADVKLAVECYERIARFHILSLHQLSNPDNLLEEEHFDAHQEREQLNNTLLSLIYYYDDHRERVKFPNEAEFRAYLVIFEIESQKPDIEDRMQSWPGTMLKDERVRTALKLYNAATSPTQPLGPLQPFEPSAIAQNNAGSFWNMLASKSVPYMMACLAELYFAKVRFGALDALWRSCKQAPLSQQARSRDWTLDGVTDFLGFDSEEQTREFCAAFDLSFAIDHDNGDRYLDLTANTAKSLEQPSGVGKQIFSHKYVEKKRFRRTLAAVIKGLTVAEAIRSGSTESEERHEQPDYDAECDDQSMFVPENEPATASVGSSTFKTPLNPSASAFTPSFGKTTISSPFGQPVAVSTLDKSIGTGGFGDASSSKPTGFGQLNREPTFGQGSSSGGFGSSATSDPTVAISAFGKPATSGGFGSSTASTPSVPVTTFGKPASSAGFGSSTTSSPFGVAPSLGPFTQQPQPITSTSTSSTFGAPTPPSFPTLGQPAPQQQETPFHFEASPPPKQSTSTTEPIQPPAPVFGSSPGTTVFAPSTSSSNITCQPNFGQNPPVKQQFAPAQSLNLGDKSTTKPAFTPIAVGNSQSSTSAGLVQASDTKPASSSLFAPPEWLTSPSQSLQPSLTGPTTSQSLNETSQEPSCKPTGLGSTSFKPFFNQGTPKASVENTSFFSTTESATTLTKQLSEKPFLAPSAPSPQPQRSTTPPYPPRQPPTKPVFTQADRRKLVANVARIGFTQPNGLLSSYLEFALNELLTTAFKQHQRESHVAAIASIRKRILARKFGYHWRQRAWNSSLNRRAKNRRQMFAETIRAEQARKQRSEEALEEILKAAQESRRLQKEIEAAAKTPKKSPTMSNGVGLVKVAGQKRKSFSGPDLRASTVSSSSGAASLSSHKRSKTKTTSELSTSTTRSAPRVPAFRSSVTQAQQHASDLSRSSTLGRSTSNLNLRKSTSAQKLDATRTDYFRLKAIGVDPDTPIIPDTKESLAIRRRREAEERQASIDRASRHNRPPTSNHIPPISTPPPPVFQTRTPEARPTLSTSTPAPVEDDLLRQMREAREAMTEQTNWFKEQIEVLEKQTEQEQDLRRSQSSQDAATPLSSSGLARANGYEYVPADTKPGFSLSRTEQRIRRTGAHGLATKPLRSSSDYVPVAMSKRSAAKQKEGTFSSPGRTRSHDDVEPSYETENAHRAALNALKRPRAAIQHPQAAQQQKLKPRPKPVTQNGNRNQFQLLQSIDPGDEETEDLDDEDDTEELFDEEEEEPSQSGTCPAFHKTNGDYTDEEQEELDDEDENDYGSGSAPADGIFEEEEELEEEDEEYMYPAPHLQGLQDEYEDAETPASNPQVSRAASSAPGGSVDDAFVIDDSD